MERRSLLKAGGALTLLGVGAGVFHLQTDGEEGRVFWRQMAVDANGEPGSLIIFTEALDEDGSTVRDVHPEYADALDGTAEVPKALHNSLQDEYGPGEPYYLIRYDGYDCDGIPGDEGGDAIEVTRTEFNALQLGECVQR